MNKTIDTANALRELVHEGHMTAGEAIKELMKETQWSLTQLHDFGFTIHWFRSED